MAFIEAKNLGKAYKGFWALKGVEFKIEKPENIAILGPNGSGKSTLIKLLCGILYPDEGDIKVLGFKPYKKQKEFLFKIGYLNPQKSRLIFDVNAMDNLYLFGSAYGLDFRTIKKRSQELAQMLGVEHRLYSPVRTLSFGERVKIELITGLLHEPEILLLDEPFIGLDFMTRKTIKDFLNRINSSIVITSHIIETAVELSKNVVILNKGRIIYQGKWEEILEKIKGKKTLLVYLKESKIELPSFAQRGILEYGKLIEKEEITEWYDKLAGNPWVERIEVREPEIEDIIAQVLNA